MSPHDIIEFPGYPGRWGRRILVEMWQKAGSPAFEEAGRTFARQQQLFDGHAAGLPGYNPADDPNNTKQPRAHIRGAAIDFTYRGDIAAAKAAGFIFPYPWEWWHGEVPNVLTYPLVYTVPSLAGGGATPIPLPTPESTEGEPMLILELPNGGWYLCFPKHGGGLHAVALPGDSKAGDTSIPRINFKSASEGMKRELSRYITGLPF